MCYSEATNKPRHTNGQAEGRKGYAMEKKYYVIGGQYESICYGASSTLAGAKRIARKHAEYWDNWQGWHIPDIYRAEDVHEVDSCGRITTPDGQKIIVPGEDALPCAFAWYKNGRAYWEGTERY